MNQWPDDLAVMMRQLVGQITQHEKTNKLKELFYRGSPPVRNMGIAIPENLVSVTPAAGWPAILVDSIAERIDFLGYSATGGHGEVLAEITRMSGLRTEFPKAVTDSLVYGVGFLEIRPRVVGGIVRAVARAVDPMSATFRWNDEGTEVAAGLVVKHTEDGQMLRTLYLPDETWWEVPTGARGKVEVRHEVHGRGIAGLVPILNRVRSGHARGHSEITPAVQYLTEHGVRTLLGMEYNREIYTAPGRHVEDAYPETVGMSEEASQRENRRAAWNASMSSFTVFPPTEVVDEDGNVTVRTPKVGQFTASSPGPYIDELKMVTQMIAAEGGIPAEYLGFVTDNPSSAEAIQAREFKLVKKSELKNRQQAPTLVGRVAPLMWHIVFGEPMAEEEQSDLDVLFRNPAMPTLAAAADAWTKAAGAGLVPGRSAVGYELMGFTPEQIRRIEADWARDTSRALVGDLADRAAKARAESTRVEQLKQQTRVEGVTWDADDAADDG